MPFKLIGASLVVASAAFIAHIRNREIDEKISQIKALCSLISFFRSQIDLFCVPVGEIFKRADANLIKKCRFAKGGENAASFSELEGNLPDDVLALLSSFSSELGTLYREEQLKSCDHYISRLKEKLDLLESNAPKQKKLNTVLFLSAAIGIVILFI